MTTSKYPYWNGSIQATWCSAFCMGKVNCSEHPPGLHPSYCSSSWFWWAFWPDSLQVIRILLRLPVQCEMQLGEGGGGVRIHWRRCAPMWMGVGAHRTLHVDNFSSLQGVSPFSSWVGGTCVLGGEPGDICPRDSLAQSLELFGKLSYTTYTRRIHLLAFFWVSCGLSRFWSHSWGHVEGCMKTTGLDAIAAENKVYYCMAYTVLGSSELVIAAETTSLHMLRTSILVPSFLRLPKELVSKIQVLS